MLRPGLALATALMLILIPFSGCLHNDNPTNEVEDEKSPPSVFVTGPDGQLVDENPLPLVFNFSDVGED